MPYKDPIKQREAIRNSVAKLRARNKGITGESITSKTQTIVIPRAVKPKMVIPFAPCISLKSELTELQTQLVNITTSLAKQGEQLTAILTQLLTNKPISQSPNKSNPPKTKQLTKEEKDEKRRAYDRARNKSPHRKAQISQYKKNARLKKKLAREMKNN